MPKYEVTWKEKLFLEVRGTVTALNKKNAEALVKKNQYNWKDRQVYDVADIGDPYAVEVGNIIKEDNNGIKQ